MHFRVLILLILAVVFACENEPRRPKVKKAKLIQASKKEVIKVLAKKTIDTITSHYYSGDFHPCKRKFSETIVINDSTFELSITAKLLPNDSLFVTKITDEDSVVNRYVFHGINELYSFQLLNEQKSECFNTTIDRKSFIGKIHSGILLDNARFDIKLIDYAAEFDAFVFAVYFSIPDSDVGSEVLLLMNKDGEIIENIKSQSFGSASAYTPIQISENGKLILSSNNLLISDHDNVQFDQETDVISSNYLFDEDYVLVVYAYNDSLNRLNAKILDTTGRIQSVFRFEGYSCELSCQTQTHYVNGLDSYYLFDHQQQQFRKLSCNPIHSEIIPISTLKEHNSVDSNEVKLSFNFVEGKQEVYIDTITGMLKYIKPHHLK